MNYKFSFSESEDLYEIYSDDTQENVILTNAGNTSSVNIGVGDSFDLSAYRSTQIVNDASNNTIIEPTFDFTIISGGDIVELLCDSNGAEITAKKEGQAKIVVRYQATIVYFSSGIKKYSATDEISQAVIIFNVGDNDSVNLYDTNQKLIDYEFDTVYMTDDSTSFSVMADGIDCIVDESGTIFESESGIITLSVKSGNNIFEIVSGQNKSYQVIKGKKIECLINGDSFDNFDSSLVAVGDTIEISFDCLDMAVKKMAGIYNPSYKNSTYKANGNVLSYFIFGEQIYSSYVSQYDINANSTFSMDITPEIKENGISLYGGCLQAEWYGASLGRHRADLSGGVSVELNAETNIWQCGYLPEIDIKL